MFLESVNANYDNNNYIDKKAYANTYFYIIFYP